MTLTKEQIEQALAALPKENQPAISAIIGQLEAQVRELTARVNELSWAVNPDRSGGQFTQDEIYSSGRDGWIEP